MKYLFVGILTFFFILVGMMLPYAGEIVGESEINSNAGDISDTLQPIKDETSNVNFIDILVSIFTLAFWVNPYIPFLIEIIFIFPLKIVYLYLLVEALPFT